MKWLQALIGDPNKREIEKLNIRVAKINELESAFKALSDDELRAKTDEFKKLIVSGSMIDEILPEAFALVREAAKRTLGQRHFDVQTLGALVLHQGQIAEMKTGEGKTLTSTLAIYLNALEGKGVHVVTVNDYLSKRDAHWMGSVFNFLGLSVGCIQHMASFLYDPAHEMAEYHLRSVTREQAYAADITYGTNNEFGFDYLRDHMVQKLENKVQRGSHYAIIDEVDSILMDEARTPLIISAPAEESAKQYYQFASLVRTLKENVDYNVDEKMRASTLTEGGIAKMEKLLGVTNIYESGGIRIVHHIEQALKAHTLFKKDRDYVVKDGLVIIVDEFTGRLMPGRRFSEGLHQALEAKEGLPIARESVTLASITFQNYFRLYNKLAGMTGTAITEAEEFSKIYNLEVVDIPTHRLMVRHDMVDVVYKTEETKLQAVAKDIKEKYAKGQPVLVGTISIEKNERLGDLLTEAGIPHNVLNAKNHEQEAKIIAQAGRQGAITVATNMAGRGVDIILGGAPYDEEKGNVVRSLGGLHVIGTERHEARRIDNQLRGRSGRQGDPGSSQFYVSLEDDLMRIFGERIKNMMAKLRIPDDIPIENRLIARSIESSQKKVEGHHFDTRKHLVQYDDVINKHRETIYKRRDEVLENFNSEPDKNSREILKYIEGEIEHVVSFHTADDNTEKWNIREIWQVVRTIFPLSKDKELSYEKIVIDVGDKFNLVKLRTHLVNYVLKLAKREYEALRQRVNGTSSMAHDHAMRTHMEMIEKDVLLRAIDTLWIDHLEAMDYLRTGIGLRGYGQRDPLIEYKREAYRLFIELMGLISKQIVYTIYKVAGAHEFAPSIMESRGISLSAPAKTMSEREAGISRSMEGEVAKREQVDVIPKKAKDETGKKIGRNDPCYCGSGKKYKKCHGNG